MKIFQFIRFLKAVINTIFGRGAILLLPVLPAVASCQHSAFFNAGDPLLLDEVPGAKAAFSVRQLSSTYTGSAVEVRRASDNATQNIGFYGGEIDLAALTSFCNGTNCFVKTWYDQSGNGNNATQTTAANQPKIWDSSTGVVLENGKPAIQFDGTNDAFYFLTPTGLLGNDEKTIAAVFRGLVDTLQSQLDIGSRVLFGGVDNISKGYGFDVNTGNLFRYYHTGIGNYVGGYLPSQTQYLGIAFVDANGTNPELYANGTLKFSNNTLGQLIAPYLELPNGYTSIGNTGGQFADGRFQEVIFYTDNKTANRLAIETNVNNFFSIY